MYVIFMYNQNKNFLLQFSLHQPQSVLNITVLIYKKSFKTCRNLLKRQYCFYILKQVYFNVEFQGNIN